MHPKSLAEPARDGGAEGVPGEGGEVVNKLRPTLATTLEKFGYMLETPPYPRLLADASDNAWGDADNQQGSPHGAVPRVPRKQEENFHVFFH